MSGVDITILGIIHRVSDCFSEGSIARKYYSFRSHSATFTSELFQQLRQKRQQIAHKGEKTEL